SDRVQCGPCRFEHRGGVEDYCLAAARLLAPGAPFVACASARQRGRVEAAAAAAGLALEAWRDVVPKEGKAALFSVYALRRAAEAATRARVVDEPPLVLRGRNGRFTEELDALRRTMGIPV
ncbi:MAG TPA: SAM-dependent methyltransferase, partial [Sorangium sp.]|nr:SAM-dependent methyltransferase [Sorangium sp.]